MLKVYRQITPGQMLIYGYKSNLKLSSSHMPRFFIKPQKFSTFSKVQSSIHLPPVPVLKTNIPNTYTNYTLTIRTPKAIDEIIANTESMAKKASNQGDDLKFHQGQTIVEKLLRLKYEIINDKEIRVLDDTLPDVDLWNSRLSLEGPGITFLQATMLYSECYVYRAIAGIFSNYTQWKEIDYFRPQKRSSYLATKPGVIQLAKGVNNLFFGQEGKESDRFKEVLETSLWGNRSDLAFFANLDQDEVDVILGLNGMDNSNKNNNILINEKEKIWERISKLNNEIIDIVLDNSGQELFGDLVLADYLLQKNHASQVYLHGKTIPWFVSDTTLPDLKWLLEDSLNNPVPELQTLATRWIRYLRDGKISFIADSFWTSPYSFWHLPSEQPELFQHLKKSGLVVFKGDLNYRKLIGDGNWGNDVKFTDAIGPFGNAHSPFTIALKTCKSEPLPGLSKEKAGMLDHQDKDWRINGKFAVIQSNIA